LTGKNICQIRPRDEASEVIRGPCKSQWWKKKEAAERGKKNAQESRHGKRKWAEGLFWGESQLNCKEELSHRRERMDAEFLTAAKAQKRAVQLLKVKQSGSKGTGADPKSLGVGNEGGGWGLGRWGGQGAWN